MFFVQAWGQGLVGIINNVDNVSSASSVHSVHSNNNDHNNNYCNNNYIEDACGGSSPHPQTLGAAGRLHGGCADQNKSIIAVTVAMGLFWSAHPP